MDDQDEFTGTHQIVLPANFLQSADAAAELYEDELKTVPANLTLQQFEHGLVRRLFSSALLGLAIWLVPTSWMTCV